MILAFHLRFRKLRRAVFDANTNIFRNLWIHNFRPLFSGCSGTAQPCTKTGHLILRQKTVRRVPFASTLPDPNTQRQGQDRRNTRQPLKIPIWRNPLMFRKISLLLSLSLLLGFSASAQDSKADVYVGYQYTRQTYTGTTFNMNGAVGQIAVYPTSWFGIVGEVSGSAVGNIHGFTGSGGTLYSYMGGPRLAFRHGPLQPYVQGLFGVGQLDSTLQTRLGSPSSTAFATAVGGGLDLKASRHFAVRLVQGDYFLTRFTNPVSVRFSQNNFRLSTGLVFRF
jgi:hypothetical protein